MNDLRVELAQEWAKKHNIQLSLFSRQDLKGVKATKREKKLTEKNEKNKEKIEEICRGMRAGKGKEDLDEKEFKEMCKKARVDRKSLCKTIFTESLKSS